MKSTNTSKESKETQATSNVTMKIVLLKPPNTKAGN